MGDRLSAIPTLVNRSNIVGIASLLIVLALVPGCAGMTNGNSNSASHASTLQSQDPVTTIPPSGTSKSIYDPETGNMTTVLFGQNYMAASGRRCAYYFNKANRKGPFLKPSGITCQANDKRWIKVPTRILITPGP